MEDLLDFMEDKSADARAYRWKTQCMSAVHHQATILVLGYAGMVDVGILECSSSRVYRSIMMIYIATHQR